jgi:hypothetical protein
MKEIFSLILAVLLLITMFMATVSCTSSPEVTTNPPGTTTPPITKPTPTTPTATQVPYKGIVEDLIRNSSTFKYDGIERSIKFVNIIGSAEGDKTAKEWKFTVTFQTTHPGHGDRAGQILAQVITDHTAIVIINDGKITSAFCDDRWDLLTNKALTSTVSGTVISGGDTTQPGGPTDTPRKFVYTIQKDDGSTVNVSYTAYPPSPVGDEQRKKILLSFRGGAIQVGDLLNAQGTYNKETNTLEVGNQNDYIFTTISEQAAIKIAFDFITNNNVTFKFDGIPGSLKFIKSDPGWISSFRSTAFNFTYQTQHPGHGDRTGQVLAQVITDHTAVILINLENGTAEIATCDKTWNMMTNKELPVFISGFVLSGGDTTPADGPRDTPRTFVYKVQKEDGTLINVSYVAYPPSPVGDANKSKITLEFYAGSIQFGDRIYASGMLDKVANTIMADYIRTEPPKVEVTGRVISGGDTTPEDGPQDAPRKFIYKIQKDDGTTVNVTYTAYPPSPTGNATLAKITLSYYDGPPKEGDYLKAYGSFEVSSATITLVDPGDFIKTYPVKP